MNELNKKQIKGIDIVVKSTSRKFPFIKSWELYDEYQEYNSILYINLIVDLNLVKDYFNFEWNPEMSESYGNKIESLGLPFLPKYKIGSPQSPEYTKKMEKTEEVKNKIEKSFQNLYENLPDQLVSTWQLIGDEIPVTITISHFLTI